MSKHIEYFLFPLFVIATLISLGSHLFSLNNSTYRPAQAKEGTPEYMVTGVIDGDTIELLDGSSAKLAMINAPSLGECYGAEARLKLNELIMGKILKFEEVGKDEEARRVGYAYIHGNQINHMLVEEGFAHIYPNPESETVTINLQKAEEAAKKTGKGIWSKECIE